MKRYEDYLWFIRNNGITNRKDEGYAIEMLRVFLEEVGSCMVRNKAEKPHRFFKFEVNGVKFKIGVTLILKSFTDSKHYYWCEVA